jgi:hypothetical protein
MSKRVTIDWGPRVIIDVSKRQVTLHPKSKKEKPVSKVYPSDHGVKVILGRLISDEDDTYFNELLKKFRIQEIKAQ